jgi:hypothetical protein
MGRNPKGYVSNVIETINDLLRKMNIEYLPATASAMRARRGGRVEQGISKCCN